MGREARANPTKEVLARLAAAVIEMGRNFKILEARVEALEVKAAEAESKSLIIAP